MLTKVVDLFGVEFKPADPELVLPSQEVPHKYVLPNRRVQPSAVCTVLIRIGTRQHGRAVVELYLLLVCIDIVESYGLRGALARVKKRRTRAGCRTGSIRTHVRSHDVPTHTLLQVDSSLTPSGSDSRARSADRKKKTRNAMSIRTSNLSAPTRITPCPSRTCPRKALLTVSHDDTSRCEGFDGEKRTAEMPSKGGVESSNCSERLRGQKHHENIQTQRELTRHIYGAVTGRLRGP